MSARWPTSVQKQSPLAPPQTGRILQRQCACGNHATGGECVECSKKQRPLQRKAANQNGFGSVPLTGLEVGTVDTGGALLEKTRIIAK